MSYAIATLWTVFLALSALTGCAERQNPDSLAQDLIVKSGLEKQVQQLPELVRMGVMRQQQESQQIPPQKFERLQHALIEAFHAQTLQKDILTRMQAELTEDEMEAALVWWNSSLGGKIARLEEEASTPQAMAAMAAMAATLQQQPPAADRLTQIRRLEKALEVTELTVDMTLNIEVAAATSLAAALLPAHQQPSFDALSARMEKKRAAVKSVMEPQVLVSLLYTYKSLEDAELDQYIAFAESEPGRKSYMIMTQALGSALTEASRTAGKSMGNIFKEQEA